MAAAAISARSACLCCHLLVDSALALPRGLKLFLFSTFKRSAVICRRLYCCNIYCMFFSNHQAVMLRVGQQLKADLLFPFSFFFFFLAFIGSIKRREVTPPPPTCMLGWVDHQRALSDIGLIVPLFEASIGLSALLSLIPEATMETRNRCKHKGPN